MAVISAASLLWSAAMKTFVQEPASGGGISVTAPQQYLAMGDGRGSVEHYYHFLLGLLLPLALHVKQSTDRRSAMLVRSCGPLDPILRELALPDLIIRAKKEHAAIDPRRARTTGLQRIELQRFDLYDDRPRYAREELRQSVDDLRSILSPAIEREATALAGWRRPRISAVARGAPDPYHLSADAEMQGSGASRRSVANQAMMESALSARFPGLRSAQLEHMPLARQVALFEAADVVVAQHGAALGNIVWMRPGAHVIEILGYPRRLDFFKGLADAFDVYHQFAPQIGDFGRVLVSDIVRRVTQAIERPEGKALRAPFAFAALVKLRQTPSRARQMLRAIRDGLA